MNNPYLSYQIITIVSTPEEQEIEKEIVALSKIISDKQNKLTKLREDNVSKFIKLHSNELKIFSGSLFYNTTTNNTYFIEDKNTYKVKEC